MVTDKFQSSLIREELWLVNNPYWNATKVTNKAFERKNHGPQAPIVCSSRLLAEGAEGFFRRVSRWLMDSHPCGAEDLCIFSQRDGEFFAGLMNSFSHPSSLQGWINQSKQCIRMRKMREKLPYICSVWFSPKYNDPCFTHFQYDAGQPHARSSWLGEAAFHLGTAVVLNEFFLWCRVKIQKIPEDRSWF